MSVKNNEVVYGPPWVVLSLKLRADVNDFELVGRFFQQLYYEVMIQEYEFCFIFPLMEAVLSQVEYVIDDKSQLGSWWVERSIDMFDTTVDIYTALQSLYEFYTTLLWGMNNKYAIRGSNAGLGVFFTDFPDIEGTNKVVLKTMDMPEGIFLPYPAWLDRSILEKGQSTIDLGTDTSPVMGCLCGPMRFINHAKKARMEFKYAGKRIVTGYIGTIKRVTLRPGEEFFINYTGDAEHDHEYNHIDDTMNMNVRYPKVWVSSQPGRVFSDINIGTYDFYRLLLRNKAASGKPPVAQNMEKHINQCWRGNAFSHINGIYGKHDSPENIVVKSVDFQKEEENLRKELDPYATIYKGTTLESVVESGIPFEKESYGWFVLSLEPFIGKTIKDSTYMIIYILFTAYYAKLSDMRNTKTIHEMYTHSPIVEDMFLGVVDDLVAFIKKAKTDYRLNGNAVTFTEDNKTELENTFHEGPSRHIGDFDPYDKTTHHTLIPSVTLSENEKKLLRVNKELEEERLAKKSELEKNRREKNRRERGTFINEEELVMEDEEDVDFDMSYNTKSDKNVSNLVTGKTTSHIVEKEIDATGTVPEEVPTTQTEGTLDDDLAYFPKAGTFDVRRMDDAYREQKRKRDEETSIRQRMEMLDKLKTISRKLSSHENPIRRMGQALTSFFHLKNLGIVGEEDVSKYNLPDYAEDEQLPSPVNIVDVDDDLPDYEEDEQLPSPVNIVDVDDDLPDYSEDEQLHLSENIVDVDDDLPDYAEDEQLHLSENDHHQTKETTDNVSDIGERVTMYGYTDTPKVMERFRNLVELKPKSDVIAAKIAARNRMEKEFREGQRQNEYIQRMKADKLSQQLEETISRQREEIIYETAEQNAKRSYANMMSYETLQPLDDISNNTSQELHVETTLEDMIKSNVGRKRRRTDTGPKVTLPFEESPHLTTEEERPIVWVKYRRGIQLKPGERIKT